MRTVKHPVPQIDTSVKNLSRYFNQMNWKGLKHNQNIFEVDQHSLVTAKNLFVNYENSLVARDPLNIDQEAPEGYELIEMKAIGKDYVTTYRKVEDKTYLISCFGHSIEGMKEYHLSVVEHYVICFNELGAKVFDVNEKDLGWLDLTNERYVEIPIIKRYVGSSVTEYPTNGFTDAYKEQYIWSNQSRPSLPAGTAVVELNTSRQNITLDIPNTNILTDYRILRPLNIVVGNDALVTSAGQIVCVAYRDFVMVSYNNGATFDKVFYPEYDVWLNIASISRDGQYFFFVAKQAVFRLNLADKTWTYEHLYGGYLDIIPTSNFGTDPGVNNICDFMTGDIYSFITYKETWNGTTLKMDTTLNVYYKGPGIGANGSFKGFPAYQIFTNKVNLSGTYSQVEKDCNVKALKVTLGSFGGYNSMMISGIFRSTTSGKSALVWLFGISDNTAAYDTDIDISYGSIKENYDVTRRASTGAEASAQGILLIGYKTNGWYNYRVEMGVYKDGASFKGFLDVNQLDKLPITSNAGFPYKLSGGWIDDLIVYNNDATQSARLPSNKVPTRSTLWVNGDYLFVQVGSTIWTNKLLDDDSASLTYLYGSDTKYTEVPALSYADTELYLAFDNDLKITANVRDGINIRFNLPKINDNAFISQITGMLNISTTELALFFVDKVIICTKVIDDLLGYRYDYYNTKLSTGIRYGESVINTLEGSHTLFPTRRGLAFMNYQAYMATSDQILQYLTDEIKDLWTNFWDGGLVRITQWRSHLILTNGTTNMMVYDLRSSSWWQWEIPIVTNSIVTDQVDLKLISTNLYRFDTGYEYRDFPKTKNATKIDWTIVSQPLHMSAPNYYKNLKQLVFQLIEGDVTKSTINVQIKLYRKKIEVREPEIIEFKIDEFRTFVKRFNYWKINEVQWGLSSDDYTVTPYQLRLNGVSVKYELGEEVR